MSGEELYHRFLEGDESAFEGLVMLYRGSLTRYISGFVDTRLDAEELALDAFAELAAGRKFRGLSSLKTYLFSIGRHIALKHAQHYMNFDCIPAEELAEIMDRAGRDENTPETAFLEDADKARLHEAMAALKPEYREALYLRYFEYMSYAEIGNAMKKSENQIKILMHRAKASLKQRMLAGEMPTRGDVYI